MAEERVQRRLAAILAADVVGYSRLMAADEAGTLAILKARRREVLDPLVARHQGRIFKIAGDGVLVEFGSAVNAVQCAVDVQQGMAVANADQAENRRIVLRVGVNLGDVIVEGSDLYGDGVNIAARLEGIAEPGTILVSGTAYDHTKTKVKTGFDDLGVHSLKNIAEPVRVYRVTGTPIALAPVAKFNADKPSIAVLPFTNMSGSSEQDYFTDGITEDIITELSRFSGLLVIARHSSFAYRGKSVDARQVGRELNVQYLLEGSIRVVKTRARITAQLISTVDGSHVWAERYDRELSDIFSIQDEISRSVSSMSVLRLQDDRLVRSASKPPNSITAYEWWLRGKHAFELETREGMIEAQALFSKALEIDTNYARAIAGLAIVHNMATSYTGWGVSLDKPHQLALDLAQRAAQLDPTDNIAEIILGWCHMFRRQFGEAKRHFDRAYALNPNDADGLAYRSSYLAYTGQFDEAELTREQALRHNPHHPNRYLGTGIVINVLSRRYGPAIDLASLASRDIWPEFPGWLAVAQAHLGNVDAARTLGAAFLRNVKAIWRGDSNVDDRELVRWFLLDNPIQHKVDIDHFLEGLRIAGLRV